MSVSWRQMLAGVIALLLVPALWGVLDALTWWIAALLAVVVVLLLWPRSLPRLDVAAIRVIGATLVAVLVLAGINVVVDKLGLGRLPILLGLILAVLVFWVVACWYLQRSGCPKAISIAGAGALAVGLIIVTPLVVGIIRADSSEVPPSERVKSELDVTIVSDGRRHTLPSQLPANPTLSEFDVRYSVGVAAGDEVRWTLVNDASRDEALEALARGGSAPAEGGSPVLRTGADSVLLLLVDGTAPVTDDPAGLPNVPGQPDEISGWRRTAAAVGTGVPTYPLLQTTDPERLGRWKHFGPGRHGKGAVSVQKLGSQTVTDAAVRLAVAAETAQADLALAMAYRPILLFDGGEPVPWPLSVNALFNERRITLCHDAGELKTQCDAEPLERPAELEGPGTHLRIETKDSKELRRLARTELEVQERAAQDAPAPTGAGVPPAATPPPGTAQPPADEGPPIGAGSTIYVHPSTLVRNERELLYLDYWWYLPDNPVGVGGGALCGAGFVIAGVTCQNHQSDWEGITVLVDRTGSEPEVKTVQYAQHESVVRYGWKQLREYWDRPKVQSLLSGIGDSSTRPLAFVASGTHATYPTPCRRGCHQVANPGVGEGPHRGNLGWVGNDTGACGKSSCLQMLPTRAAGEEPALWNAYEGPWGERHCFLTYYCDSGSPPNAPGQQERYEHPARYDGVVGADGDFRREPFEE